MLGKFTPNPKLIENTTFIKDLDLCALYIRNNASFPWLLLIPRRDNIVEIFDLEEKDRLVLIEEINEISLASKKYFKADKINIASFGNIVAQMHVHIIARFIGDSSWPQTAWNSDSSEPFYNAEQIEIIISEFLK